MTEFADRIPAPRPVPTTRRRLDDARSHALEVERDDLRIQTGRLEADNRAMMRDRDQALAERDKARAQFQDALWTAGQHATTAASLRQQRDRTLADLTDAGNEVDQLTVDNARLRSELGAAQELIAVLDDAVERIDRARAAYATRGQQEATTPALGSLPPRAQEGDAWAALDEAMGPVLAQAVGESVDAAEIERYADQLRNDAAQAEDAVAVGLLRAADGLTDLLAEREG